LYSTISAPVLSISSTISPCTVFMYAPESLLQKQVPAETADEIIRKTLTGVVSVADGNRHAGTGGCGVGWCRLHHWEKW